MSAIIGVYNTDDRKVERADLEQMLGVLAHRGPDGSGCWQEGAIGLGHRMFWNTPESLHETLPLVDSSVKLAITADARIDNREEIFTALRMTGVRLDDVSDSELILAAYIHWEEECVSHLDGDFAFAIWDGRKRQLFCARDRFGIKPFYYYHQQHKFIFASEIKGILTLDIPHTLNEYFIAGYLIPLLDDVQATAYIEIKRFPPAHTMIVNRDGCSTQRYWRLDTTRKLRLRSDAEYAEAFREIFTEAVRCRLRSAFPVGSMLSGGMDSSSITCVARHLLEQEGCGRQLHTFSAVFPSIPSCDERQYIDAVLNQGGVISHIVPVDHLGPFTTYCKAQKLLDEPFIGTTLYLHWGVFQVAQQHIRTLLDGQGGDSIVSHGLTYFQEMIINGHWVALLKEARAASTLHGWPIKHLLWEFAISPLIPSFIKQIWHRLHRRVEPDDEIKESIVNQALAKSQRLRERMQASSVSYNNVRIGQRADLESPASVPIFEWFNGVSIAHNIDIRYPFFDRRVAEFCLSLPSQQKLHKGWTRMVLRRAMDGYLPDAIQWRIGKSDLAQCFFHNLHTEDHDLLLQTFHTGMKTLSPYIEISRLWEECQHWLSDEKVVQQHWKSIWYAATLTAWLQKFPVEICSRKEGALAEVFNTP